MAKRERKYIYKIDSDNKIIYIDESIKPSADDRAEKVDYLSAGYVVKKQKRGKSIEQMRNALSVNPKDADVLAEFNLAYDENKDFFGACRIYTKWEKAKKEAKKKEEAKKETK